MTIKNINYRVKKLCKGGDSVKSAGVNVPESEERVKTREFRRAVVIISQAQMISEQNSVQVDRKTKSCTGSFNRKGIMREA